MLGRTLPRTARAVLALLLLLIAARLFIAPPPAVVLAWGIIWLWLGVAFALGLVLADPRALLLAPFPAIAMLTAGNLGRGIVEPGDDEFVFLLLFLSVVGLSVLVLGLLTTNGWRRLRLGKARIAREAK